MPPTTEIERVWHRLRSSDRLTTTLAGATKQYLLSNCSSLASDNKTRTSFRPFKLPVCIREIKKLKLICSRVLLREFADTKLPTRWWSRATESTSTRHFNSLTNAHRWSQLSTRVPSTTTANQEDQQVNRCIQTKLPSCKASHRFWVSSHLITVMPTN